MESCFELRNRAGLLRFIPYFIFLILALIVMWPKTGWCVPPIRLVADGRPLAVIVIPGDAPEQLRDAAGALSEYVEKASGARLSIVDVPGGEVFAKEGYWRIWIGPSDYVRGLRLDLGSLGDDGFVIAFPDEQNIVIVGPTNWGAEFGVYEFLERYIGIRWLLPGPAGEFVPQCKTIDIPREEVRREPAFFSRVLSGLRGEAQKVWVRRNRMHGRLEFHHNLFRLFPPEKYEKTHPEFYPVHGGGRYLPPDGKTTGWQPCFSAPGLVEEAVKNICDYFGAHPEATSYSLGVNDSGGFCRCAHCMASYGRRNYLKREDASNIYFRWANAVVEGVLKRYPDKRFGCLAFSEVAEPPSEVSVHPRIVPFLTYDRMKWVDKEIEKQGKSLTERWLSKASQIGWYDYIYGAPYCVPRIYFHEMKDYCAYGASAGVKAMYAEAYPNWGEGPKLYLTAKLWWDPGLDVDSLLDDWYNCTVGKDAAPYLRAYYRIWEEFWTRRVPQGKWFRPKGQYLWFSSPAYLHDVEWKDLSESRRLLESALKKAGSAEQKARAGVLLKAFEYYEASAASYKGLVDGSPEAGRSKEYYERMNKRRYDLVNAFENDPLLLHPSRFDKKPKFNRLRW